MDDQGKTIGTFASSVGVIALIIAYQMGWISMGGGHSFDETEGVVLACYSEFCAIDGNNIRVIDWVEFTGTVSGRLEPLVDGGMPDANETTSQAARLLVEMAAVHPIQEAGKLKQCADELVPLIEKIKG